MPLNIEKRGLKIPKIGDVRKGEKIVKKDEHGNPIKDKRGKFITYPHELDYFRFVFPDPKGPTAELCKKVYGDQPKSINCFLASSQLHETWDVWYEAYTFSQLIARSTEQYVQFLFDTVTQQRLISNGKVIEMPNDPATPAGKLIAGMGRGDKLPYDEGMIVSENSKGDPVFLNKAVGRLGVIIPEFGRYAYLTVHTGGKWNDVPHITYMISVIYDIAAQVQRSPMMIPFTLSRFEVTRKYMEDGKKKSRIGWDVQMEISQKIFTGLLQAYADTPVQLLAQSTPPALQPPDDYLDQTEENDGYLAGDFEPELDAGDFDDIEPTDEPTPFDPPDEVPETPPEPITTGSPLDELITPLDATLISELIEAGFFNSEYSAKNVMARCKSKSNTLPKYMKWAQVYRDWKKLYTDEGVKAKEATDQAIKMTNSGKVVGKP